MKDISNVNNLANRYSMQGTCAKEVLFTVEDNRIYGVEFIGGCPGNAIGLSTLLEGMPLEDVTAKLENVMCGTKGTSCPSELAKIIKNTIKVEVKNA